MKNVLQVVFWITCLTFVIVLGGLIWGAIVGAAQGREYVLASDIVSLMKRVLPIWLAGAGILWIYGFVVLGRGWAARPPSRNLLLLAVLLVFGTLVSPYFYWKRETL